MALILASIIVAAIIALAVGAVKTQSLRKAVKDRDPGLFIKLGSPIGVSPDSAYGTRQFQRFLYGREFRSSPDSEIRRIGQSCYRWGATGAVLFALSALGLAASEVFR